MQVKKQLTFAFLYIISLDSSQYMLFIANLVVFLVSKLFIVHRKKLNKQSLF